MTKWELSLRGRGGSTCLNQKMWYTILKMKNKNHGWQGCGESETLICWGNKMVQPLEKTVWSSVLPDNYTIGSQKTLLRFSRSSSHKSFVLHLFHRHVPALLSHNREDFCSVFPASCYLCSTVQEACLPNDSSFWVKQKSRWEQCSDAVSSQSLCSFPPYLWAGKCFLKWWEHWPDLCVTLKCLPFPEVLTGL